MDRIFLAKFATPVIFGALSAVFGALAVKDSLRGGASRTPAARARARIALIFGLVSLLLFWLRLK